MFLLPLALAFIASLASPAASAAGQEDLARAKNLYAAAAYDDALSMLERLQQGATGGAATEIAQYRAFCLLALQRTDAAKKVVEGLVRADPTYRLPEGQGSPRIHSLFQSVRRVVLLDIVQRTYAEAKDAFDRQRTGATAQFDRVLSLMDDPDMRGATSADFRTVVVGFRDLSRALASTREVPASGAPDAIPPLAPAPAAPLAGTAHDPDPVADAPPPPTLASTPIPWTAEVTVDPPVALSQPVPRWVLPNGAVPREGFSGRLEIEIDEQGKVTSAALEAPIYPGYDDELLRLARSWRFKPAMKNGVPIPFVTIVEIQRQRVRQ